MNRFLATGAQARFDEHDRINLRVGYLDENARTAEVEFDIDPFTLQLVNQMLDTVVEQQRRREEGG